MHFTTEAEWLAWCARAHAPHRPALETKAAPRGTVTRSAPVVTPSILLLRIGKLEARIAALEAKARPTMTQAECLDKVRAVAALERVKAVIALNGTDADWPYVVTAIEWELRSLRYVLSFEPQALIDRALALYADERRTVAPAPHNTDPPYYAEEPPPGRVH